MYQVKMISRPCPVKYAVVDLKLNVGRCPRWLDGAQIGPYNFCTRVCISKIAIFTQLATLLSSGLQQLILKFGLGRGPRKRCQET